MGWFLSGFCCPSVGLADLLTVVRLLIQHTYYILPL